MRAGRFLLVGASSTHFKGGGVQHDLKSKNPGANTKSIKPEDITTSSALNALDSRLLHLQEFVQPRKP